eukprot:Skav221416  [mRNA]  locus=scaffold355:227353:228306:+ [translate_table: standard]
MAVQQEVLEQEIPDYANLPLLPHGTTMSLWENKAVLYNEPEQVATEVVHPPQCAGKAWTSFNWDDNWWFLMVTKEEYDKIVDKETGTINKIPGGLRSDNGWEQLVFLPSTEEAAQWLAYHMSQFHVKCSTDNVLLAMKPSANNLTFHNATKRTNHFQRGQSVLYLQVHAPYSYKMTEEEQSTLRVMTMAYNPLQKLKSYVWTRGWMWIFGHAMHVATMARCPETKPHMTILSQALTHLGQEGTTFFNAEVQATITQLRSSMGMGSTMVQRPIDAQRGHPGHADWVATNNPLGKVESTTPQDDEAMEQEGRNKRLRSE